MTDQMLFHPQWMLLRVPLHQSNNPQVACLTMQAEFIKQVEGHEDLMKQCYPDAGLKFSFTVAQIHAVFDGKSPRH